MNVQVPEPDLIKTKINDIYYLNSIICYRKNNISTLLFVTMISLYYSYCYLLYAFFPLYYIISKLHYYFYKLKTAFTLSIIIYVVPNLHCLAIYFYRGLRSHFSHAIAPLFVQKLHCLAIPLNVH